MGKHMTAAAFLCAALLIALIGGGAAARAIELPADGALPGWQREGALRRFSAADLYGHINGGAELFLELGFAELLVQSYRNGEEEIALEVYRMDGPTAALAIYLFKCGEETSWPEIAARNSSNRFQAVIVHSDCFVLVNSFSGRAELRPAMADLAGRLLETIPAADPGDPFSRLPAAGRVPGSERLIRGPYSLQALYTLGPGDILQLGGSIVGVAADYSAGSSVGEGMAETLIHVPYPDQEQAGKAFAHLAAALDPSLEVLHEAPGQLAFRDFAGRYGQVRLDGAVIEIRVNLAEAPGLEELLVLAEPQHGEAGAARS
jgi:hypothetical protein